MEGLEKAVRSLGDAAVIDISVSPNARHDEMGEVDPWRGRLGVKIKAPPVEGKANRAVVRFFSEVLGIPEAGVTIVSGERSGQKTVKVDLPLEEVRKRLLER